MKQPIASMVSSDGDKRIKKQDNFYVFLSNRLHGVQQSILMRNVM
jgi:hypothetical protein